MTLRLSVEGHYGRLGKPAVAAVLAESDERSFLATLGWVPESHDADTQFQLASVASARRALRGVDTDGVVVTVEDGVASASVPGARVQASRRTPTTGSASGASRWRPSTAVRGSPA